MQRDKRNEDLEEQCVAFARRWLCENHGLIYDDVPLAADLWDRIDSYVRLKDGARLAVDNVLNGASVLPGVGDLLVYSEKYRATGHVAVVAEVHSNRGLIGVLERNFRHATPDPLAARHIPVIEHGERHWLLDGYLLGWKRLRAE